MKKMSKKTKELIDRIPLPGVLEIDELLEWYYKNHFSYLSYNYTTTSKEEISIKLIYEKFHKYNGYSITIKYKIKKYPVKSQHIFNDWLDNYYLPAKENGEAPDFSPLRELRDKADYFNTTIYAPTYYSYQDIKIEWLKAPITGALIMPVHSQFFHSRFLVFKK